MTTGNADLVISRIVTDFTLAISRHVHAGRATLLAYDPNAGHPFRDDPSVGVMYIAREVFEGAKRDLESRSIRVGGSPPLLRQKMYERPWFDLALDITDDYVLFRVHQVHDLREALV